MTIEDVIRSLLTTYQQRMEQLLFDASSELREELREKLFPTLVPLTRHPWSVDGFQATLPAPLLPSLMAYLGTLTVECDIEWDEVVIPGNTNASSWQRLLGGEELWSLGLMQVAIGPSGDPVCFDLQQRHDDSEYPVIIINHDWVSSEEWNSAQAVRKSVSVEFPSFLELLRTLCEGIPIPYQKRFPTGRSSLEKNGIDF